MHVLYKDKYLKIVFSNIKHENEKKPMIRY